MGAVHTVDAVDVPVVIIAYPFVGDVIHIVDGLALQHRGGLGEIGSLGKGDGVFVVDIVEYADYEAARLDYHCGDEIACAHHQQQQRDERGGGAAHGLGYYKLAARPLDGEHGHKTFFAVFLLPRHLVEVGGLKGPFLFDCFLL